MKIFYPAKSDSAIDAKTHSTVHLPWLIWFFIYFVSSGLALSKGQTSLLASTVDEVELDFIALLLLNIPLHLACAFSAMLATQYRNPKVQLVGNVLAAITTIMIVCHISISLVVDVLQ